MERTWTPLIFTQQIPVENLGQALCQNGLNRKTGKQKAALASLTLV